jgi:hypothetical protein
MPLCQVAKLIKINLWTKIIELPNIFFSTFNEEILFDYEFIRC